MKEKEIAHCHGNRSAGQSMHCYQSIWMTRLTQTSGSAAPQVQTGLSLSLMSNRDGDAKKFTQVTDMRTVRVMNKGVTPNERLDCQPFQMFNFYQNIGCTIHSKNGLDNIPQIGTAVRQVNSVLGMKSHGSRSREHLFQSEKVSQCFKGPETRMIQYESNKGKAPQLPFVDRHATVKQLTLGSSSKEYVNSERNDDLGKFSIPGHNTNWDDHVASGKFETSFMRTSNAEHNKPLTFTGEQSKKIQKLSHSELFPNRMTSMKETKSGSLSGAGCPFKRPGSMRDIETTGQMEKSKQGIEESSDSLGSNKNMFSRLLSLPQPLNPGQKGIKIQLLDSSSESREKHDAKGILDHGLCQKNESSAETATMDMETFKQRNNLSGVNSFASNKNFSVGQDPPSQATIAASRKRVECKRVRTRLPDMNEIPVVQVSSPSLNDADPSTSRTQSLDAEHLVFHNEQQEQPINHKTSRTLHSLPTLEPSIRWLKRLKLSGPHSCDGIGTKSSNDEKAFSHQKVNKSFNNGHEATAIRSAAFVERNVESSSVDPPKEVAVNLLSHSWIKRWCKTANQKKKDKAVVVYEPQSTKMDFDELRNKQFPSIGAMALMGKAMNGFQPCEFQRRGSFVVWNTKSL